MLSYDKLFKRARNVLDTRFNIDIQNFNWTVIEPFLKNQLIENMKKEEIQNEEIKYFLEILKRQNPTKFYLLELELIKEIRNEIKKEQRPTVRHVFESINIMPRKDDDEFESDDRTGFIYK